VSRRKKAPPPRPRLFTSRGVERAPRADPTWHQREVPPALRGRPDCIRVSVWSRGNLIVISDLVMAKLPQREDVGAQWHVSLAIAGHERRATDDELARVRIAFGMVDAEEDNHEPGRARHLWMPVLPEHRVPCECAEDETTIVEDDGHRWQTKPEKELAARRLMTAIHTSVSLLGEAFVVVDATKKTRLLTPLEATKVEVTRG
jgi:hypothetical protein